MLDEVDYPVQIDLSGIADQQYSAQTQTLFP
jgi:hypothetical protein